MKTPYHEQKAFPNAFIRHKASLAIFFQFPIHRLVVTLGFVTAITFSTQAQNNYAPSNLGPFELQPRTSNPIREPFNTQLRPTPVPIDFDRDGDLDVVMADYYGGDGFQFLRNDGTSTTPSFNHATSWANPFQFVSFALAASPAFTDIDGDGDHDMLMGAEDGRLYMYESTGVQTSPLSLQTTAWNSETKNGNPFLSVDLGSFSSPVFIDIDNDNDKDVVVGTTYEDGKSIYLYKNDGLGNYDEAELTGVNPVLEETTPWFFDIDNDGDQDLLLGAKTGDIYFYKRTGPFSFEEQTGTNNPFSSVNKGPSSSLSSGDFDGDGDQDVILGSESFDNDIFYFENRGNGVFVELLHFSNPFGGYSAQSKSSPVFVDLDDDGFDDLIIGNTDGTVDYLRNDNGNFIVETDGNPFKDLSSLNTFSPSVIDLDGDGDKDLAGSRNLAGNYLMEYYKNENGIYVYQAPDAGPFAGIVSNDGRSEFGDLDDDGDYDLILSDAIPQGWDNTYIIRYFQNTGTAQSPQFTERTGTSNPFGNIVENFVLAPRTIDIDHDGDLDLLVGEGGGTVENSDGNEFSYYENVTATAGALTYIYRGDLIDQGSNPTQPCPSFVDYDNDGDLDIFMGSVAGDLYLYKNVNTAAVINVNEQDVNIPFGNPAFIDENLSVTDADNDSLVYARITIIGFESGNDELNFTPQANINSVFDEVNGILQFEGKAPISAYQTLLRGVALIYQSESSNGRKKNPQETFATVAKAVSIEISDSDGTTSVIATRTINFTDNVAPIFANSNLNLSFRGVNTINLAALVTDADGNLNLGSFEIIQAAASGAVVTISASSILTIDYSALNFSGSENITLSVCDDLGECDQAIIALTVLENTAPLFNNTAIATSYKGVVTLSLTALIEDAENNVDLSTLTVTEYPSSGAAVSIDEAHTLHINYSAVSFGGTEEVRLRVCDIGGECAESTVTVTVDGISSLEVFNAVAPKSSGDNKWLRITNLPNTNKVTIYNRWGDVVFKVDDYNNETKRFEGISDSGKDLSSGTYFYKIEYISSAKKQTISGYLSLIN